MVRLASLSLIIVGFSVIIASGAFAYIILDSQQSNNISRTTNYWSLVYSDDYKTSTLDEKIELLAFNEAVTQQDIDRIKIYEARYFLTLTIGIILFTLGSSLPYLITSFKELLLSAKKA